MTDTTISLFLAKYPTRPAMNTPWTWNGYTGATDGYALLLVPGEDTRYQPCEFDIARILPDRTTWTVIQVEHLRETLDAIPLIPEMIDETVACEECNGTGIVECSRCSQDTDCDECNGKGKVETPTKPTGKLILNDEATCAINNVSFQQRLLRRLLAVADEVGVKTIDQTTGPGWMRGTEFIVNNDIRVIIMPYRHEGEPDIRLDRSTIGG